MNTKRLEQLNALLEKRPEDPFLWHAKGLELARAGAWSEALPLYQKAVALDEHHVGTYYHLGKAYEELDQLEKARDTYQKGIAIATRLGDHHAKGELQTVLMLVEDDLEE